VPEVEKRHLTDPVEPGVDHYFDHPDRELRSLALLEVLLKEIGALAS